MPDSPDTDFERLLDAVRALMTRRDFWENRPYPGIPGEYDSVVAALEPFGGLEDERTAR